MDYAFTSYKTKAIASESSYPYTARDGTCKSSCTTAISKGGVSGYVDSSGASGLMSAIIMQPVSVAVEANQAAFQSYSGSANLDHVILAVRYNSAAGDYPAKSFAKMRFISLPVPLSVLAESECDSVTMLQIPTGQFGSFMHGDIQFGGWSWGNQITSFNPVKTNNVDGILDLVTYAPKVLEIYGEYIASNLTLQLQDFNSIPIRSELETSPF
jgi:hypothetical protein